MDDKGWCMNAHYHKEGKKGTNLSFHILFSRHILCHCPLILILFSLVREEMKPQTIYQ
jgi:hypothetical protein